MIGPTPPQPPVRPDHLRFGVPSKGRLQSQTADFLAEAGIKLVRSAVDREYAGALVGVEGVELVFLGAGDMPEKLLSGDIHIGVTGEDLVRERSGARADRIALLKPLGFGHADLVIAAPKCWIDVASCDDLDDVAADFRERHGHPLRIATKYMRLARAFLREKGVANYRIVESQGATEGTIAAGSAEAIVDITSSGETLRANHLKVLTDGLILKSEAQLCASMTAAWTPGALSALRAVLDRLGGGRAAKRVARITARIDAAGLARAEGGLARAGAHIRQRPLTGFPALAVLGAPASSLATVVDLLTAAGAETVETALETQADDPAALRSLYESFVERLNRFMP